MTTATASPLRPITGWTRLLAAALVFGSCWGIAIWYWRGSADAPSAAGMLTFLVALPSAVVGALWLFDKRRAKLADAPAVAAPLQPVAEAHAQPALAMLAAALRLPHGESPEELATALLDNTARADLDPELVDDDGYPVMTARIGSPTDEAVQEELSKWWIAHKLSAPAENAELRRAVAMGTEVVSELAGLAGRDLMPAEGAPPMLRLVPLLPQEWTPDDRRAAGAWLAHTVVMSGWPQDCITVAEDQGALTTPGQVVGQLIQAAPTARPAVALVIACASNIGEETVARWTNDNSLFTSSSPQGLIPGEGAAGLLLADARHASVFDNALVTLLDAAAEGRRDVSADEARRTDSTTLGAVTERALKPANVALSDIAVIVADTGHRSNRVSELMEYAAREAPQLDGMADVVRVGAASGTCGHVPYIAALALGRHHALVRSAPVLCISNEDPYRRCSVLVRPADSAERQPYTSA